MKHKYCSEYGIFVIETEDGAITGIGWSLADRAGNDCTTGTNPGDLVANRAFSQLCEYFRGERRVFDLPLKLQGTPFQHAVWDALQTIPYGETLSYGGLAARIGHPKAARAVGGANNKNPIAIVIPCHRVIGSRGQLVGYAGGLDLKRKLLALESAYSQGKAII